MQSVSSRIWTRVAVFIFYDDNNYTTGTSTVGWVLWHINHWAYPRFWVHPLSKESYPLIHKCIFQHINLWNYPSFSHVCWWLPQMSWICERLFNRQFEVVERGCILCYHQWPNAWILLVFNSEFGKNKILFIQTTALLKSRTVSTRVLAISKKLLSLGVHRKNIHFSWCERLRRSENKKMNELINE